MPLGALTGKELCHVRACPPAPTAGTPKGTAALSSRGWRVPGVPAILMEELLGFILLISLGTLSLSRRPRAAARSGTARRRAPIASPRVVSATRKRFGGGGKAARAAGFVGGRARRGGSYAPPAGASSHRPTIGPMAFNFSATAGAGAANPTGERGGNGARRAERRAARASPPPLLANESRGGRQRVPPRQ